VKTLTVLRVGSATHTGRQRESNEDRLLVDAANGIFLVADGMGGHAAGEVAAEIARDSIYQMLVAAPAEPAETILRRAITEANSRILARSEENPAWRGMACVLTVAVVRENCVTWGHVGDSRLYLYSNGKLCKLTRDHSPVGEQEDSGAMSESVAMRHPRRNEVFRNLGSAWHPLEQADFAQVGSMHLPADAALLLCSDGLSDALTSAEITAVLKRFGGDADATAQELVAAANERSGADNVSVVFVAGPGFSGEPEISEDVPRHAVTRVRPHKPRLSVNSWRFLYMLFGIMLGALLTAGWQNRTSLSAELSNVWANVWAGHVAQPARK
jgi:serine/threonine protein phosphatase PrpC